MHGCLRLVTGGSPVELMLLDLGSIDPTSPRNPVSGVTIEVVNVNGIWEE